MSRKVHEYRGDKSNKASWIYAAKSLQKSEFLTELIRIEKNNGFSNADCTFWMRVRDDSNWSRCTLITGLRPTAQRNLFYGDYRKNGQKTLVLVRFETQGLTIFEWPPGQYPHRYIKRLTAKRGVM